MNDPGSISVLIHIYKCGRMAEKTSDSVFDALREFRDLEMVFCDDGSSDDSWDRLLQVAARHEAVRLLRYAQSGLGVTLNRMVDAAQGDICIYLDVDLSFDVSFLPALVHRIKHYDIVVASRYGRIRGRHIPVVRRLCSVLYYAAAKFALGVPVRDIGSGMVVFSRDRVKALKLVSQGFDWHLELYHKAKKMSYRVHEEPIPYVHRKGGTFAVNKHALRLIRQFLRYVFDEVRLRRSNGVGPE